MDPDQLPKQAGSAYEFWNKAGAWVAAHPKSTIGIALAVILAVIVLTRAL